MSDEARFPIARAEVRRFYASLEVGRVLNQALPVPQLIALFTESLVFGAFTVLYAIAIWILLYREKKRSKSTLNKMLFATSTTMWVLSVAVRAVLVRIPMVSVGPDCLQHLALDVDRAIQAFVVNGGTPNGTLTFYSTLSNPTEVAKNVIYITMTLVGDTFVTYRLFVVWNHSWMIIVLPVILLLATAGAPPPLVLLRLC